MKYTILSLALGLAVNAGVLQPRGGDDAPAYERCPPPQTSTVLKYKTSTVTAYKEKTQTLPPVTVTSVKKETKTLPPVTRTEVSKDVKTEYRTTTLPGKKYTTTIEKTAQPVTLTETKKKVQTEYRTTTLPGKKITVTESSKATVTKEGHPTTVISTKVIEKTPRPSTSTVYITKKGEGTTQVSTKFIKETPRPTTLTVTREGQPVTKYRTTTREVEGRVSTITKHKVSTTTRHEVVTKGPVPTTCPKPETRTVTQQKPPTTIVKNKTVVSTQYKVSTKHENARPPPPKTRTEHAPPPAKTHPLPPPPPPASGKTAPPQPKGTCPLELPKEFEYPHLIIPVDSSAPRKAPGTSYNGKASGTITSLFNFDIPPSAAGKECRVVFALPLQSQLETSSFTSSGNGNLTFASLAKPVGPATSFENAPKVHEQLKSVEVKPGNAYEIDSAPCKAGEVATYAIGAEDGYELEYFQDYNPCPIGLYVIPS